MNKTDVSKSRLFESHELCFSSCLILYYKQKQKYSGHAEVTLETFLNLVFFHP